MTEMNAGTCEDGIEVQHRQPAELRDAYPEQVIPFAVVDPRHKNIVATTRDLIEKEHFRRRDLLGGLIHEYERAAA